MFINKYKKINFLKKITVHHVKIPLHKQSEKTRCASNQDVLATFHYIKNKSYQIMSIIKVVLRFLYSSMKKKIRKTFEKKMTENQTWAILDLQYHTQPKSRTFGLAQGPRREGQTETAIILCKLNKSL